MNKPLQILCFLLFSFSAVFSCAKTVIDYENYVLETEPNEKTYEADEIETGSIFAGKIVSKSDSEPDTDLYKIWRPAGTEITIEFETDEKDFQPYIGHGDNLGHGEFVLFDAPGRYKSVFVTSIDGWQYFEIGDKRNTDEKGKIYDGFSYYFRVSSKNICDYDNYDKLNENKEIDREFEKSESRVDIVELSLITNDFYQIKINSRKLESDKSTFIFNCDSGESAGGNDDEDYSSNLLNPLIYSRLETNLRYLAVTGRVQTYLNESGKDNYSISLKKQLKDSELEPNNIYNYSNVVGKEKVKGFLSDESVSVLGEKVDDQDWFRYDFLKGQIVDFAVTTENNNTFSAEFWAGAYEITGTTIIPLKFSMLSGVETHHVNMMMPFTGTAYFLLSGKKTDYELSVANIDEIETLFELNGSVSRIIETPDCRWAFYKWNMPENGELFEIRLTGSPYFAGIHVFSKDLLPYAFVEPVEFNRIFIHRYEKTESLILGFYLNNCEQQSNDNMKLRIAGQPAELIEWNNGFSSDPVKTSGTGSYSGFFDTDNYFVENNFEIEIEEDGMLYLSTAPHRMKTAFDIDTVVTLFKDGEQVADNDDMIDFLNYNKYSRLSMAVKKGEKYTVRIKPFMTESSHIPSMNIIGYYILDIIIK